MENFNITPCKQEKPNQAKLKFNIKNTKKCLANTRKNTQCQAPAMKNGRCRLHGGKSTGAITQKGLQIIKKSNLKHGKFTKKAIEERRFISNYIKNIKKSLEYWT